MGGFQTAGPSALMRRKPVWSHSQHILRRNRRVCECFCFSYMCIYVCMHLLLLYFELWSESFQSHSFNSPASQEGRTSKPSSDYNTKGSRLFLSLKGRAVGQERQFGNDKLGVQKGTESRLPKWLLPVVGGSSVNTSEVTDHTQREAWNFLAALPGESMCPAWMLWGKDDSIFKAGA